MKVAVFSAKPYDRQFLVAANAQNKHTLQFFEPHLGADTSALAVGFAAVCVLPKGQIQTLLADGMYVDGAWMHRLKQEHGIDIIVRLHEDMAAFQDALQMVRADPSLWERRSRSFTAGGTKNPRRYRIATIPSVAWDSYGEEVQVVLVWPEGTDESRIWGLATPNLDLDGWTIFRRYGKRWWLENRGNRELKEAYGLEHDLWTESEEAAHLSLYLRLVTYNLIQLYRREQGEKLAARGLRSLRQEIWEGPRIVVIVGEEFAIYHIEEFAGLCGNPPRISVRARGRDSPRARPP
jgi:hypothetical protein